MHAAIYPGSFDPITKGHMNIIEQASELFDEVVVAVMQNSAKKNGFFTLEERLEIISELYEKVNNIKVPYQFAERRPGDVATCFASPKKAKEELGFVAEKTLEDMCRDAYNFVIKNK